VSSKFMRFRLGRTWWWVFSILIACRDRIGRRKPPDIDKRRGVPQIPFQVAAEAFIGPAGVRDENAALPVNHSIPPACEVDFQPGRDQGGQILAHVCGPVGVIEADARLSISGGVPHG